LNYECRRKIIKTAQKVMNTNFSDDKFSEAAEIHIRECREILALSKKRESVSTADLISKTVDMTGNINEHPDRYVARYCIPGVDRVIKHRFKEFHVLGAPSGCGKTSFALSAMEKQIDENVKHVLFCNETDAKTLMQRLICIHANIDFDRINAINDCAASNIIRVTEAVQYFNDLHKNFKIYGKGDYEHTLNGIASCLKEDADTGLEPHMVTVDYIQNLRPEGSLVKAPRHQKIEELIFGLSEIFAEFNVAGLALSQLNRDKNRDNSSRDSINADLKGSSAIEQQADYITFLKRKTIENKGEICIRWFSTKLRGSHEIAVDLDFNTGNGKFIGIREN
jgi:replicative DNA helicase